MALIHPKKVKIGYELDQNTNLLNTFKNNRRKCKKVKIQRNMDDFNEKSAFHAENRSISKNEPNQTNWQRLFAFFVIFHKLRFSA